MWMLHVGNNVPVCCSGALYLHNPLHDIRLSFVSDVFAAISRWAPDADLGTDIK